MIAVNEFVKVDKKGFSKKTRMIAMRDHSQGVVALVINDKGKLEEVDVFKDITITK